MQSKLTFMDNERLIDREYFVDYCDCVLDYVDEELLDDDLYDIIGERLEDIVFEMFLFNIQCGMSTHIIETILRKFQKELSDGK